MPRFKQLEQIIALMSDKTCIRNLGIIAHIDHGKTTLTDSLLAGAGLLSPSMAGTARVLDYLEEEQKRKITIKTACISLLYSNHVINLVDTPGHVDFTGKVTRALRAIDGAIVVVDAVEGIMAQTEIVTKQAFEERVRPVLFINKVDRLITELQLTAEQIERKLQLIINSFNNLVELYCDENFKAKWMVDPVNQTVAIGSALYGWGFTLNTAKLKAMKFAEIVNACKNNQHEKLREKIPLHEAIFSMAIENMPNPKQAQSYRIETIWDGRIGSQIGRIMTECRDDAPTIFYVTSVHKSSEDITLATGRLFSGTVKKGDRLHMLETQTDALVEGVFLQMGAFNEEAQQVKAGNIAALSIRGSVKVAETIVDLRHKEEMVPFEAMSYISEPVVAIAVEPKNPKDLSTLQKELEILTVEDPNLSAKVDRETGEQLLSGMGELHLEIALKQLGNRLQITSSSPRVAYRESVTKRGGSATAKSPNKQNSFVLYVEPLEETDQDLEDGTEVDGAVLAVDEHRNVLVDLSNKILSLDNTVLESVIAGFEFACLAGPLCGEPLRHVKTNLTDLHASNTAELPASEEIARAVSKAVFGSFLMARPILLEPVYKTVVSTPIELAGECQHILSAHRGKTVMFEQRGMLAIITVFIPVAESFELSRDLRSATSGRAFWQSTLERWDQIPEKIAADVVEQTRKRKGLPADIPRPETFLEAPP